MTVAPKLIYKVNVMSVKILIDHSVDLHKLTLKVTWKNKHARIAKKALGRKISIYGMPLKQ